MQTHITCKFIFNCIVSTDSSYKDKFAIGNTFLKIYDIGKHLENDKLINTTKC